MGSDQLAGAFLLAVAVIVFVYYTLWVIVLPFIDPDVGLHAFFPPRFYAIAIPTVLLVVFVGLVTLFIGLTMLRAASAEKRKKKQPQASTASAKNKRKKVT
ncbi:dolichol phosphate-mannose biosynthesis regulatory protein [Nannochloropsis oceanica]